MSKAFENVRNIEFSGYAYVKELKREIPVFTLTEPSVEEWNAKAKIANTKAFISEFGREPESYEEVEKWVNSLVTKVTEKAVQAGTYTTL